MKKQKFKKSTDLLSKVAEAVNQLRGKPLLESGREWYDNLHARFAKAFKKGDFDTLSQTLGHDPDYEEEEDGGGDCLSPEELRHDPGWTWDCVREQFLEGRGSDDPELTRSLAVWLGVDVSGLEHEEDWDALIRELRERL